MDSGHTLFQVSKTFFCPILFISVNNGPAQCESGAESADKTHGNTFCWIYGPKTKDHTDGKYCYDAYHLIGWALNRNDH